MDDYLVLWKMKMRQGYNNLFGFSKKGYLYIIAELMALIGIIYISKLKQLDLSLSGIFIVLAALIIIGNSYTLAEKYLFCSENKCDLLAHVLPRNILKAVCLQIYWGNLRVINLIPFISLIINGRWLSVPLIIIFPLIGVFVSIILNVFIKKYIATASGAFYIISTLLWASSILLTLYILIIMPLVPEIIYLSSWIVILLLLVIGFVSYLYLVSEKFTNLWGRVYLEQDIVSKKNYSPTAYIKINGLIPLSFTTKDWILLSRHPIIVFRFIVFVLLIIVAYISNVQIFFSEIRNILLSSSIIWLICFGELPSIAWQNEGDRICLLWLSGKSPGFIIMNKIVAQIPFVILGCIVGVIFSTIAGLTATTTIQVFFIQFFILVCLNMFSLTIAMPSFFNGTQPQSLLFEQVPLKISSMFAHLFQLPFLCMLFLPLNWALVLCFFVLVLSYYLQRQFLIIKFLRM